MTENAEEMKTSIDVCEDEVIADDEPNDVHHDEATVRKRARTEYQDHVKRKKLTSGEIKKHWNQRLSKLVAPKQPIVVLNEMLPQKAVVMDIEPVIEPFSGVHVFTARCEYDGQRFEGSGPSKMSAKNVCAEQCIQYVVAKKYEEHGQLQSSSSSSSEGELKADGIPWSHLASLGLFKLFHDWNAQGLHIPAELLWGQNSCGNKSTIVEQQGAPSSARKIPADPTSRHPVQLLYELATPKDIDFNATETGEGFAMTLNVRGQQFAANAKTKKEAKRMCAENALATMFDISY